VKQRRGLVPVPVRDEVQVTQQRRYSPVCRHRLEAARHAWWRESMSQRRDLNILGKSASRSQSSRRAWLLRNQSGTQPAAGMPSNSTEVRSAVVDNLPQACPKKLPAPLKPRSDPNLIPAANPLGIGSPRDTPEPSRLCRRIGVPAPGRPLWGVVDEHLSDVGAERLFRDRTLPRLYRKSVLNSGAFAFGPLEQPTRLR
jgi:hypothetical protein